MQAPRFQLDDTIGAIASAAGPAVRGIVRISGTDALRIVQHRFQPTAGFDVLTSRQPTVDEGLLAVPQFGDVRATRYAWPGSRSYTRQPMVELHLPGSPPLLDAVLASLFGAGVRPALPGEFTLRAFLAGRIDLVQAEAVLGVIDAGGAAELNAALRQLAGGISAPMAALRNDLLDLLADLEAGLDFTDEGIEFVSREEVHSRLARHALALGAIVDQADRRTIADGRARIVLAGLPNAGKSTLFNALLQRQSAIVSATPGTTRDWLRGTVEWNGLPIELIDTPGVENARNSIERQAYELASENAREADLILWCRSSALDEPGVQVDELARRRMPRNVRVLDVATKADLSAGGCLPSSGIWVAAVDAFGLNELLERCVTVLSSRSLGTITDATAARCRESLSAACGALGAARDACDSPGGDELIAIELRLALDHLGRVLGSVSTDDLLDRIFSRFCIGK